MGFDDRQFNADGTFRYPRSEIPGSVWIGEYFGDVMLVNGKVWPFLDVEPRLYRFRILNGCNARILNLSMSTIRSAARHRCQVDRGPARGTGPRA